MGPGLLQPQHRTFELARSPCSRIAWLGIVATRPTLRLGRARRRRPHFAAFVWLSDPFVLYAIGVPAALVAVADLFVVRRRRPAVTVLAVLAVSALAAQVARWILELSTCSCAACGGERHLTDVSDVFDRARLVLERYAALLGVSGSDLTSGPVGSTALAWLRLGLVVLGVAAR